MVFADCSAGRLATDPLPAWDVSSAGEETLNESVLLFLLVGVVGALLWLTIHFVAYRNKYLFTLTDMDGARKEAVRGSHLTKGGQIAEQLAPLLPGFCESFNPKDARFLGHPIDFIVFDGLEEGEVRSVVLLEIKSGGSSDLNKRQRQVRRAVDAGHVRFETLRFANISLGSPPQSS